MPTINANGIDLAYQVHGDPGHPTMLLIQGLGMPLSGWPVEFVQMVVAQGFRAILFDNRDIGRSQLFDHVQMPNAVLQVLKSKLGLRARSVYQLHDMAADAKCLMDALDISAAHVVGISMGGMIAQLLAIDSPDRVTSLTSIMSTTGNRHLPGPDKPVERHILRGPGKKASRERRLDYQMRLWSLIGSPDFPTQEDRRREWLLGNMERGLTADGITRQMLAIIASPDRTDKLRNLAVPTLVLHGDADPLVPVECGHATAMAIPDADMMTIPGMGHDLPEVLQPRIIARIAGHARKAADVK